MVETMAAVENVLFIKTWEAVITIGCWPELVMLDALLKRRVDIRYSHCLSDTMIGASRL